MATKEEKAEAKASKEKSPQELKGERVGQAVGPDVDASFHAPDFYDPQTGKRIDTEWDSEGQRDLPDQPPLTHEQPTS